MKIVVGQLKVGTGSVGVQAHTEDYDWLIYLGEDDPVFWIVEEIHHMISTFVLGWSICITLVIKYCFFRIKGIIVRRRIAQFNSYRRFIWSIIVLKICLWYLGNVVCVFNTSTRGLWGKWKQMKGKRKWKLIGWRAIYLCLNAKTSTKYYNIELHICQHCSGSVCFLSHRLWNTHNMHWKWNFSFLVRLTYIVMARNIKCTCKGDLGDWKWWHGWPSNPLQRFMVVFGPGSYVRLCVHIFCFLPKLTPIHWQKSVNVYVASDN